MEASTIFRCRHLWTPEGWRSPAWVRACESGTILEIRDEEPGGASPIPLEGWVLPGMPDLHSHAFQRGMLGRGQRRGSGEDDFWTWREAMYACAAACRPEDLRDLAAWLQVELLEGGFTRVAEFHYLHRPGGADPIESASALFEAAGLSGIGYLHLPVLYLHGGLDGDGEPRPLGARQEPFSLAPEARDPVEVFLRHLESLEARFDSEGPGPALGSAAHSLRAVTPDEIERLRAGAKEVLGGDRPFHLHAAEQPAEVEAVRRAYGLRPLELCFERFEVGASWCFVHATHLSGREAALLAGSGAVAGLCPTTEADLGDGFFPIENHLEAGGVLGVGTDSQVGRDVAGECRLLEWGARLRTGKRCLASSPEEAREGRPGACAGWRLFAEALRGGARALGLPGVSPEPGAPADFVVLDPENPLLQGIPEEELLAAWIFGGGGGIREVWVGGRRRVADGRHRDRDSLFAKFRACLERLRSRI